MKLLRSLLRIATTVCICMAIIACVTIVVRPQVLRDWPGDYGANPVVQLTGNFTPIRLAHASSGTPPAIESAPAETNIVRPVVSPNSDWVLAEAQPEPVAEPAATEPTTHLDSFVPAAPETGTDFNVVPDSFTIEAPPEGGRVRIDVGNSTALEADSIELRNSDRTTDGAETRREPTAVGETYAPRASDGDNPLPEFLRGRDLPPLAPGEEVVTVHVPVDEWVDLAAGDLVDVRSVQSGAGINSDAGVKGTIHINELERVEVYALPGIAPENSDTVPVCLKVNAPQARLLIKLRASKTPVRLMVVKSAHAAADLYGDFTPQPSATRLPLRTKDDFADPTPVRTPELSGNVFQLPEAAPTPADDSIDLRSRDDYAAPTANRPMPVPQPGLPADEPTPIATAEPQPAPAARLNAESLPAIEPSEEGTVIPLDGKPLSLTVEAAQIVESDLRIQRVSGFDPKVIRITPLTPLRLKIEALAPGRTSFRVQPADRQEMMMLAPFRVEVHVIGNDVHVIGKQVGQLNLELPTYSPDIGENRPATIAQQGAADSRDQERREAEDTLRKLYPNSGLEFVWLRDSLVLRGSVTNADEIPQIMQIAELFTPKVFNQIAVKPPPAVDADARREATPTKHSIVVLSLDPSQIQDVAPGRKVKVVEARARQRGNLVEMEETILVQDAEVAELLHGDDQVLVTLRGTADLARDLRNVDHSTVKVVGTSLPYPESPSMTDGVEATRASVSVTLPLTQVRARSAGKVDIQKIRGIGHGGEFDVEESKGLRDIELQDVHVDADGGKAVVTLRGTQELTDFIRDTDNSTLLIVPQIDIQHLMYYSVSLSIPRDRVFDVAPHQQVDILELRDVLPGKTVEAARHTLAHGVRVEGVRPEEHQIGLTLRVTEKVAKALRKTDRSKLLIVPHAGEPTTYSAGASRMLTPAGSDGAPADGLIGATVAADVAPSEHSASESSLRADIRSLHDDVRKLITLLEKRAGVTPPENGGPMPQPLELQKRSNAVEPVEPVEPPDVPNPPQAPPESTTDAIRPNGIDREMAEFLDRTWWLIGIRVTPLAQNAPQLRNRFVRGGLLVDEVRPDSPAAKAKIEVGDAIIGVRKWETTDAEDFGYAFDQSIREEVWDIPFHFVRNGRRLSTQVEFEPMELEPPPHGAAANENVTAPPEHAAAARASGLNPTATARKKLLDEIGRVILRRDYPRALELAESYKAANLNTEFAAMAKIGPENVPVLVVATAPWSAPCRTLQPLLTQLQNDGYGMVILDSDDAADAELIQQLEINAFPTLACVVDGSKQGELVGFFNQTRFDRFFDQFGDTIQELLEKLESDAGESKPGIELDIPAATSQSVRDSHGDVRAIDLNRTFQFSVGLNR